MSRDTVKTPFRGADLEDDYREQVFNFVSDNSIVTDGEIDDLLGDIGVFKLEHRINQKN